MHPLTSLRHPRLSMLGHRLVTLLAMTALTLGIAVVAAPGAQAGPTTGMRVREAARSHPVITPGEKDKAVVYLKRTFGMKSRGPAYKKAIRKQVAAFERSQGMRPDRGTVTPATWRALGVPYSRSAAIARDRAEQQARQASRSSTRSAAVLREAARHAGKPYAYGGNGPHAFDCSGFTRYVYARVGVALPRTAAQQRSATTRISRAQLRQGDLVFVHRGSYVSHVAIYAGSNMWWEATRPGRPLGKNPAWTSSVSYGRV